MSIALTKRLFSLPLCVGANLPIEDMLIPAISYDFELCDAVLGNSVEDECNR